MLNNLNFIKTKKKFLRIYNVLFFFFPSIKHVPYAPEARRGNYKIFLDALRSRTKRGKFSALLVLNTVRSGQAVWVTCDQGQPEAYPWRKLITKQIQETQWVRMTNWTPWANTGPHILKSAYSPRWRCIFFSFWC